MRSEYREDLCVCERKNMQIPRAIQMSWKFHSISFMIQLVLGEEVLDFSVTFSHSWSANEPLTVASLWFSNIVVCDKSRRIVFTSAMFTQQQWQHASWGRNLTERLSTSLRRQLLEWTFLSCKAPNPLSCLSGRLGCHDVRVLPHSRMPWGSSFFTFL